MQPPLTRTSVMCWSSAWRKQTSCVQPSSLWRKIFSRHHITRSRFIDKIALTLMLGKFLKMCEACSYLKLLLAMKPFFFFFSFISLKAGLRTEEDKPKWLAIIYSWRNTIQVKTFPGQLPPHQRKYVYLCVCAHESVEDVKTSVLNSASACAALEALVRPLDNVLY